MMNKTYQTPEIIKLSFTKENVLFNSKDDNVTTDVFD